tara:strand:- start:329 stop:985 length:657 start_codon:yes stop_codon:yes gene_type:complete
VGVFDIDEVAMNRLKIKHPRLKLYNCDVTNYKMTSDTVNIFFENHKSVDILINNAGYIYSSPLIKFGVNGIMKHDPEIWNKVINLNLSSVFNMSVNVVEKMVIKRTRGIIINITSISAAGNIGQIAYSAAKSGINAMTMTMAKELGVMGIRCVAIAPGFFETHSTKEAMSEEMLKKWLRKIPLNRMGSGDDITKAVFSVIDNDYFNGKVFELDGGLKI